MAKQKRTTDDNDCPIAKLLREHMALYAAHMALEAAAHKTNEQNCLQGRIDAIEEEASWHYATSLRGGMFQLLLANSDVETIDSFLPDDSDGKPYVARLRRYIFSILKAIEIEIAMPPDHCCGKYYWHPKTDTLLTIDLARIDGGA